MQPSENDVVRYTMIDEVDTGGVHVLLFGCEDHPDKKLTSHMLESHMWSMHSARKFTVSVSSPVTGLDAIKEAGVSTKEEVKNTGQNIPNRRERQRYDRPVPGPRQPRRD